MLSSLRRTLLVALCLEALALAPPVAAQDAASGDTSALALGIDTTHFDRIEALSSKDDLAPYFSALDSLVVEVPLET